MYNSPRFLVLLCCVLLYNCEQFLKTQETFNSVEDSIVTDTSSEKLDHQFLITGTAFSSNNTLVYLYKNEDNTYLLVDSTTIQNTKFSFKGHIEAPKRYRVSLIKNKNKGFTFLVDASEIKVYLNKRTGFSSAYSTSEIQKKYQEYTSNKLAFKDKGMSLYYGMKGDFSFENIKKLKKERLKLFSATNSYTEEFIKKYPNSYFSAMLIKDNINTFSSKKIRTLYEGLSQEIRDLEYTKTIETLLKNKVSSIKKKPVTTTTQRYSQSNNSVTSSVKNNTIQTSDEYRPKAYQISGLNPYGESISLNSIPKGKVILVDFWASWCGPCRASNPDLIALHQKYNSQGFEILSISEDKNEAEWINAIAIDNLNWDYHVIDKGKRIAFRYGVESIPFKILIDKNGNIASGKISGYALEARIQELLRE